MCLGSTQVRGLVKSMNTYCGVEQQAVTSAQFGDTVVLRLQEPREGARIPTVIGASVCAAENPEPWPYRAPDEPTFSLVLTENNASWKGTEIGDSMYGRFSSIRDRLRKEAMVNTALRVEGLDGGTGSNEVTIMGRGPLHLGVIIEAMRREGYEFELRAPKVLTKMIDGEVHEPYERMQLDFKEKLSPEVINLLVQRQCEMGEMRAMDNGRVSIEAVLPVRMMMNLPLDFNRLTGGDGVLTHTAEGFRKQVVAPEERDSGALIAIESGDVQQFSMNNLSKHGTFFVQPGDDVYYGQVVGENLGVRHQDVPVNVTKKNEQLGGMRANAVDAAKNRKGTAKVATMPLEQALGWIHSSEMVTVTPKSIRIRKPGFAGKTVNRVKDANAKKNQVQ